MSGCLWELSFISLSLKQIHVPTLLPRYDPNLSQSPLFPRSDPALVLCHSPDPDPCPCLAVCHPSNRSQGISRGAVHQSNLRPPRGVRTHLDGCQDPDALLGLICPGQPHLGLVPRHPHTPGAPYKPSYAEAVPMTSLVSCCPDFLVFLEGL